MKRLVEIASGLIKRVTNEPAVGAVAVGVVERVEAKGRPKGLERYKQQLEGLRAEFDRVFDPQKRNNTEDIYKMAKRMKRMCEGPLSECVYSGVFRSEGGFLSPQQGENERLRAEGQRKTANWVASVIQELDKCIANIEEVLPAVAFQKIKTEVIQLEGGGEPGYTPNQNPCTRKYFSELSAMNKKANERLAPLKHIREASTIIRPDDLQQIGSVRRTLLQDREFWQAILEDCQSTDPKTYNRTTLDNFDYIEVMIILGMVDKHERAFSKDGRSEADKGMAYIFGYGSDGGNLNAEFDDDKINTETIPESFADPKKYFASLRLTPKELAGRTEKEVRDILKKRYYPICKECHPDLYPGDEAKEVQFKNLSEAYEVLLDPKKRADYLRGN